MSPEAVVPRLRRAAQAAFLGVLLLASPRLAAAGATFLSMTSDPGDLVGMGQTYLFTPQTGTFAPARSGSGVMFTYEGATTSWILSFVPPRAAGDLAPGMYEGVANPTLRSPTQPGLEIMRLGVLCTALVGRFDVLEAQYGPNGEVTSFAADFEQHCAIDEPALFGSIRYNSSVGTGPRLSAAPAVGYEGDGEAKALRFRVSLSARVAGPVTVDYATGDDTATAGTDYTAASGTLTFPAGQTSASVDVPILGNKTPEADRRFLFTLSNPAGAPVAFGQAAGTILDDDTGKTFLDFASDPGEYIGGGRTFSLTPLDGTITPSRSPYEAVSIDFNGSTWWRLTFSPPSGASLVPGLYEGAALWPFQGPLLPGMVVSGDGRGCGSNGRFVVLEAKFSPAGEAQALAIDYEQHCDPGAPALFGAVRFNSLVPRGPRLSVGPAAVFEGDGEPAFLVFPVSLSARAATDVTVDFSTVDGSAGAGTDYAAASGSVLIPAGQTSAQVLVRVLGNNAVQPDRTMSLALSNAVGEPIAFGSATGTILDDDGLRTLVRLDSEEGDYIGAGRHLTLRPPLDGVVTTVGGANDLEVRLDGLSWWRFHFKPPAGRTLTVGAFEGATRWPFQLSSAPGLDASGDGRGCNMLTGRFDVLQADYSPSGAVQALAIDFEQHCEGAAAALFGSIRINSTIPFVKRPGPPTLALAFGVAEMPVGGTTSLTFTVTNPNPQDALTGIAVADALPPGVVVATPNGVGGGCGVGTITAAAGSGSVSLAGATLLSGASCTFSVNVTGVAAGFKTNTATVTSVDSAVGKSATATLKVGLPPPTLYFASEPGDTIGQGQTFTLTPADGPISVGGSPTNGAYLSTTSPSDPLSPVWTLDFEPPAGQPFLPGVYEGATRRGFYPQFRPMLSIDRYARPCAALFGRFAVLEAQFSATGELQVLAIDYEEHCGGAEPALFGSVRYNSLLPVVPRVSVAPAAVYEGNGEATSLGFWISLSRRATAPVLFDFTTVDGTAKAGVDYTPTSATATIPAGQVAVRVDVPVLGNVLPQPDRALTLALSNPSGAALGIAEAAGRILDDDGARTFVEIASDPGDPVGGGQTATLTPLDGLFSTFATSGGVTVSFQGDTQWGFNFQAPSGQTLSPGVYEGAGRGPKAPFLLVMNGTCSATTGRFVVLEAEYDSFGNVLKLAVDFEQHCEGAVPALLGSVRINSALSTAPRLSVAPATSFEGDGEPKNLGFRASLSRRAAADVSFSYATSDGTARTGIDYEGTSGSASIPAGQTSRRVDVPILGNRVAQPDRVLGMSLSGISGAIPAFTQSAGTILDDDTGRNILYISSEPGDRIGQGQTATLTSLDGIFFASSFLPHLVDLEFQGPSNWRLSFAAPPNETLSTGAYEGARVPYSSPPAPGISVGVDSLGCSGTSGRFVVLEFLRGPTSGSIAALAVDFEQHCDGAGPALYGSIRINSLVPIVPRAAAAAVRTLTPCRAFDTRLAGGPLQPGEDRVFAAAGACGIPSTVTALIANVTVVNPAQPGYLTLYRADGTLPFTSSINFPAGRTRANNAIVGVSSDGTASLKVHLASTGPADVVLDVSGYFQ